MTRPDGRRALAAQLLVAAALPALAAAATAPSPAATPAAGGSVDLDGWDRSITTLRTRIWRLHEGAAARGRDPRGRTIDDDLGGWVTTPESIAAFEHARRDAGARLAAGDAVGAAAAVTAGRNVQARWESRFAVVETYWNVRAGLDYQNYEWEKWAKRAPEAARAESRGRLQSKEALVAARLTREVTQAELAPVLTDLVRAYNVEREKLARLVGTTGDDDRVPPPRVGRHACGKGVEPTGAASPEAGDIYPMDARRLAVWGDVRLALSLSASGCPTRASVLTSSGATLLDAAALDWVEFAHFDPASMGGHPIASTTVIRLEFVLPGTTPVSDPDATGKGRAVTELGGIALGMTRTQLESKKGRPLRADPHLESFNSVDAAHDGLLTAYFGPDDTGPDARVVAVEYLGDRDSAPHELPPLRGFSRRDVYDRMGEPLSGDKAGKDHVRLRYRSGLYVDLFDGLVGSYGIAVPAAGSEPEIRLTIEGSSLPAAPATPARPTPARPPASRPSTKA